MDHKPLKEWDGQVYPRPVHDVPRHVRIEAEGQLHAHTDEVGEDAVGRLVDVVLQIPRNDLDNLENLVAGVVEEVYVVLDSAYHPGDVAK